MLFCVQNKWWAMFRPENRLLTWFVSVGLHRGFSAAAVTLMQSNKDTYFLLLPGKSSFCEDGFESLCAEKGAWGGISLLGTNSASDTVSNSCMCNCGAAIDEMRGNFNTFLFSFSFLKSSSYTIPSEIYVCCNSS